MLGTHSDVFHADEALASILLLNTREYANAVIIRTRNQQILDQLDIVYDVGAAFDVEKRRFDHHQRSFNLGFDEEENKEEGGGSVEASQQVQKIKMSSAGLIYKYFGKEIICNIMGEVWGQQTVVEEDLNKLYQKIYGGFVLEVDAIDNGVQMAKDLRYKINTGLSSRVSRLNKPWNAPKE